MEKPWRALALIIMLSLIALTVITIVRAIQRAKQDKAYDDLQQKKLDEDRRYNDLWERHLNQRDKSEPEGNTHPTLQMEQ